MTEPKGPFHVVSLRTLEHPEIAYIALGKLPGPTNWYITTDRSKAYPFDGVEGPAGARRFCEELKAGESCGLKNDGHLWHVAVLR